MQWQPLDFSIYLCTIKMIIMYVYVLWYQNLIHLLKYWFYLMLSDVFTCSCLFDAHATMHHVKFLRIKPTRCTNFSNLFLEWNATCFGQFFCPSSGVFHCTYSNGICYTGLLTECEQDHDSILILLASCQQICMPYTIAVCTVKNSWWWTEKLSETCRVSFQE